MYLAKVPAANMTVVTDSGNTIVIDHESGNHAVFTAHFESRAKEIFTDYCTRLDADAEFRTKIRQDIVENWRLG